MADPIRRARVLIEVVVNDPDRRREVEQSLLDGDFALVRGRNAPPGVPVAAVRVVIQLTPRERDVLAALAACDTTKEMGRRLGITVKAVKDHTKRLEGKFEVGSRHRLLLEAEGRGLIP